MHKYRRKSIIFLMGYLVIFFAVLVIAFVDLNKGVALFDIGMSPGLEDGVIIGFSVLAMIKVIIEIAGIESHAGYERSLGRSS